MRMSYGENEGSLYNEIPIGNNNISKKKKKKNEELSELKLFKKVFRKFQMKMN